MFWYGNLGEIIKNTHTFVVPNDKQMTFTTVFQYDSWNRVKKIAYPDGEVVSYYYNKGGLLKSMRSMKSTQTFKYMNDVQYDKFEKRIFLWGGNGTKTEYQYNPISQKLSALIATDSSGTEMMDKSFSYDNTDNIDTIIDNASKHIIGSDTIGGASVYHFVYDSLYRLLTANGSCGNKASTDTYSLGMTYSGSGKIMEKNQAHAHNNNPVSNTSYTNTYTYSTSQPHAAAQIGNMNYNYDANGNMTQSTHINTAAVKHLRWDEENRLKLFCDHEQVGAYLYDAGGERYLKIQGTQVSQDINGTQGINGYAEDGQTLYVNPFMAVNDKIYTKHFYIEGERIATKIGAGMNISESTVNAPSTPSSRKWYRPFIGFHADSTLTGFDLLTMADYNDKMLSIDSMLNRDLDSIGEGPFLSFTGRIDSVVSLQLTQNNAENQLYFYHPDHLGRSTYVSDLNGLPTQRLEYFPFGEVLVDENRSTFDIPYKFSAKELDEESGLVYYGARYYDPRTSVWLGVDPLSDKHPNESPFVYCKNNPINLFDPDGKDGRLSITRNENGGGSIVLQTTVWVYGSNASNVANAGNEKFSKLNSSSTYTDANGNSWNVSFQVNFQETKSIPSDKNVNDVSGDDLNQIDGFQTGDNVMSTDTPLGFGFLEKAEYSGNKSISPTVNSAVHAAFHNLGFDDNKTPGDVMNGADGTKIDQSHFTQLGDKVMKNWNSFTRFGKGFDLKNSITTPISGDPIDL